MSNLAAAFFAGHRSGRLYGRFGRALRPFWRGKKWLEVWDNGFLRGLYSCWWCAR